MCSPIPSMACSWLIAGLLLLLQGMDIGPDSLKSFKAALKDCVTIIWNGPMGVFEMEAFSKGTFGIAETLAELTEKVGRGCCSLIVESVH